MKVIGSTMTLFFAMATTTTTSEAALRSSSSAGTTTRSNNYRNLGTACDGQKVVDRIHVVGQYFNERSVQQACNDDPYCHGYAIFPNNNMFFTLDSIGPLDNFLNQCRGKSYIQVKEKRGETPHVAREGFVCLDLNRYDDVTSCRLSSASECDLASEETQNDCCICGGGEWINDDDDDETSTTDLVTLPFPTNPALTYSIEETQDLVLIGNPEQFNGNIPTEIYSLTKLTTLNLSANDFVGTIPDGIEQLVDLEEIIITGNHRLQGPLPDGLSSLQKLKKVNIEFHDG